MLMTQECTIPADKPADRNPPLHRLRNKHLAKVTGLLGTLAAKPGQRPYGKADSDPPHPLWSMSMSPGVYNSAASALTIAHTPRVYNPADGCGGSESAFP